MVMYESKRAKTIRISPDLLIRFGDVLVKHGGQRFALIGTTGSGKTNLLLVTAEQFLTNGWPMVFVDPMNNGRALRAAGLPILIAGNRKSANLPLTPDNAAHLARESFTKCFSVVLDVSMHNGDEQQAILEAYLGALWSLILHQDEDAPFQPYGIFIDEAHLFVPQSRKTDLGELLIDISKRGRQLNTSMFFTTQRPASIDKDFLLMSNAFFAHRVKFGDVNVVAEAISQPPKVVRDIMLKLEAGEVLVTGDAGLIDTNGQDYIRTRATKWDFGAPMRNLTTSAGLQEIDAGLLQQLHDAMEKAINQESSEPGRDWPAYKKLEAENTRLAQEIARLQAENRTLLEKAEKTLELVAVNPVETASAQSEVLPVREREWDGRSDLALQRAIKFQQRQFDTLINDIQAMPKMHRIVLTYLVQRENMKFEERELARFTGYSWSTLANGRPRSLERRGLLTYELNDRRSSYIYSCTVRQYLKNTYKDLDTDVLVDKMCKIEAL